MDKTPVIITATPNVCWLHPEVPYPCTPEERAEEAGLCAENGAAVLHMHGEDSWAESIRAVRSRSDIIIQCGMSSLSLDSRMEALESGTDMLSVIASHHDEAFAGGINTNVLHTRDELEAYASASARYGIRMEFEIWHTGSIWNLAYLIKRDLVSPPFVTTLFFNWPGGTWSPADPEEYLHRRRYLPEDSVATVSIMGEGQMELLACALAAGDHIRVGTEDNPYGRNGTLLATHELVREAAELSCSMGRPVATPAEAREILGIGYIRE
ncbi:MAG: 3-keto-5-aminohexanoate cleavage protein [Actinobacteria bacterium]|nr:3-keto-5-aminohexanoate cleavage protein [Actinomycetota bacterium]